MFHDSLSRVYVRKLNVDVQLRDRGDADIEEVEHAIRECLESMSVVNRFVVDKASHRHGRLTGGRVTEGRRPTVSRRVREDIGKSRG